MPNLLQINPCPRRLDQYRADITSILVCQQFPTYSQQKFFLSVGIILFVHVLQLTTHEFLLGAIPGLEFLFRPSMAAASASGDAQDPFFYAQVSQCVL